MARLPGYMPTQRNARAHVCIYCCRCCCYGRRRRLRPEGPRGDGDTIGPYLLLLTTTSRPDGDVAAPLLLGVFPPSSSAFHRTPCVSDSMPILSFWNYLL